MKKLVLLIMFLVSAIGIWAEDDTLITAESDYLFSFDYTSTITIGEYIIDAEGLKSLSDMEVIKLSAALILFTQTNVHWTERMTEAICEKFIPKRFKSEVFK